MSNSVPNCENFIQFPQLIDYQIRKEMKNRGCGGECAYFALFIIQLYGGNHTKALIYKHFNNQNFTLTTVNDVKK